MADRLIKLFCKECRQFCGFIRNNRPPLPNSCPNPDPSGTCKMQDWLISVAPKPPIDSIISSSKAGILTPRQASKMGRSSG
jgi:hypothetical protein